MAGGEGTDSYTISGTTEGFHAIDSGLGNDQIVALRAAAAIGVSSLPGVEINWSGRFAGVWRRGTTPANMIDLSGTTLTGITRTEGGAGNDPITGSAAPDTIGSGTGNDVLNGGGGDDLFTVAGTFDGVVTQDGGAAVDSIFATVAGGAIQTSSLIRIETISVNVLAGISITGSGTANLTDFSGVTLTCITVVGAGAADDTVTGSAGADVIAASVGLDIVTGGARADRFDFNLTSDSRGTTIYRSMDLTTGLDVIDLIGVDADTLVTGDQAFSFIGSAAFGLGAGELRVAVVDGQTRLIGDVDDHGTANVTVQLTGAVGSTVMVAGDRLLYPCLEQTPGAAGIAACGFGLLRAAQRLTCRRSRRCPHVNRSETFQGSVRNVSAKLRSLWPDYGSAHPYRGTTSTACRLRWLPEPRRTPLTGATSK